MAKQPKSKENLGHTFSGTIDVTNMTVTETTDEQEFVYDLEKFFGMYDGHEVTMSIKKSSPIESVE